MPEGGGSAVAISYFLLLRFALPRWPKLRDLALAAAFAFGARRLRSAAMDSPGLRRCFTIVSSSASGSVTGIGAGDSTGTTPRFALRLYGMVLP